MKFININIQLNIIIVNNYNIYKKIKATRSDEIKLHYVQLFEGEARPLASF